MGKEIGGKGEAFGQPGLEPRWTTGAKVGVGTACNSTSKVWFTLAEGIVTEVYYPRIDIANTRDLQFLITDGKAFFHEEKRDTLHSVEYLDEKALAYRLINTDKEGRYRITKRIFTDPAENSLLIRTRFDVLKGKKSSFRLFVLFAPHIKNQGYGNSGRVISFNDKDILLAWREDIYAALTASLPFKKVSCGFVGFSDGWQDINENLEMDWEFKSAIYGNIAFTAELDFSRRQEFTIVLGFGDSEVEASLAALTTLKKRYRPLEEKYIAQWRNFCSKIEDLSGQGADGGRQYYISAMVLKAHEDKTYPGGMIASLSIPWGEFVGDKAPAGYHLIWPRDLCKAAFSFIAMGDGAMALRALKYLDQTQDKEEGHWVQNFWLDGTPYWRGIQLDEVALPIVLAWRLNKMGLLDYNPYPMVKRAASFIYKNGPVTQQERWEENSGFSPSTMAAEIAGLICAAEFAELNGEPDIANHLREVADYWATKLEEWTFTDCGCLLPGHPEYYERIASVVPEALDMGGTECQVFLPIKNLPQEVRREHSQCSIVDGGFLELVRYGIRSPNDPHVIKTLPVIDGLLKVDTPYGPSWHRYNHDGYGEKEDGFPFDGTGIGRAWPLLTGERGQYELAAGNNIDIYISAMEGFANEGGMIPEQIWGTEDIPEKGLYKGKGTGSATPLAWAHAEYIKLLRSKRDDRVCDLLEEVYERYGKGKVSSNLTVWKWNKRIKRARPNERVRIAVFTPALLHWTKDDWKTYQDYKTLDSGLGVYYCDLGSFPPGTTLKFTFYWSGEGHWENQDFEILID